MDKLISADPRSGGSTAQKVAPEIAVLLEAGDFAGLENLLLTKLADPQTEVSYFLPVIRTFIKRRDRERAETILQLILDGIREKGNRELEISLAQEVLVFWPDYGPARDLLLQALRQKYASKPNINRLLQHVGVERAAEPLCALRKLESWLRFDEGSIVFLPGKGAGKISEINPTLNVVRVKLPAGVLSFRIEEADRVLEALGPDHILYDKVVDIESLKNRALDNPGEMLARVFHSFRRSLTVSEIKDILDGIITATQWAGWWKPARGDRRLTVGTGARPTCSWNDSVENADEAIMKEFSRADAATRLELARKNADRSPELASAMAQGLRTACADAMEKNPSLELEILSTLQKMPGSDQTELQSRIDALLSATDPTRLILSLGDRAARRSALVRVRELRTDWRDIYRCIFIEESDAGILSLIFDTLDAEAGDELTQTVQRIIEEPSRSPRLFVWLCQETMKRPKLKAIAGWPLIQSIIRALGDETFKSYFASMRKFFDAGGPAAYALGRIDSEQGRLLLSIMDRGANLEDYRRDAIRKDLNIRFRDLREENKESFFATTEAIKARQAEYEHLMKVEIPQNSEEIRKAEEHGDLRENFEYHAAKNRHQLLATRAKALAEQLDNAKVITPAAVNAEQVSVGTKIKMRAEDGNHLEITILGPWDSNPENHVYSYLAPAAAALLDSRVGDTVTFNDHSYVIERIGLWYEAL